MFTYPPGVISLLPWNGGLIPPMQYTFFSTKSQSQKILDKANSLYPNGKLSILDGRIVSGIQVSYPDGNDAEIWMLFGQIAQNSQLWVAEWCGVLFDRLTNPINGIDSLRRIAHADGSVTYSNANPFLFQTEQVSLVSLPADGNYDTRYFVSLGWK